MTRILVVENEPMVAWAYGETLTVAGFDVAVAGNGHDALTCLGQNPPALVITDLAMPGMDGVALATAMRAEPCWAHIPLILITGSPGALSPAGRALFCAVVVKPDVEGRLLLEVESALLDNARRGVP